MATASTLRTYPVGGQLDPAWLASSIPWTHVRATATLSRPDDGAPIVDPTNGAHEHPTTVVSTLTAEAADGMWATAPLKPTTSTGADLALTPGGLTWDITVEIKRGATWHEVTTYEVAPSGDRDYDGEGELISVDGDDCVDINALIPAPVSVPASSIFEDAVLEVLSDQGLDRVANVYPYLKTTGGAINAVILSDIASGWLAVGAALQTASYFQNAATGGATYRVVASGTGTSDGGSFINAGSVQLQAVFEGTVPVTCFGAKGDGTTDDTTAIGAAITHALTATSAAGITFPPGTFVLSPGLPIIRRAGFHIVGAGVERTTLRPTSSFTAGQAIFDIRKPVSTTAAGCWVSGFTVRSTAANAGTAFYLEEVILSKFEHIRMINMARAMHLVQVWDCDFYSIKTDGCGNGTTSPAFDLQPLDVGDSSNNNSFFGLQIESYAGTPLRLGDDSHRNHFFGLKVHGLQPVANSYVGVVMANSHGNVFIGGNHTYAEASHFELTNSDGNTFVGNCMSGTPDWCIDIISGNYNTVTGNVFGEHGASGGSVRVQDGYDNAVDGANPANVVSQVTDGGSGRGAIRNITNDDLELGSAPHGVIFRDRSATSNRRRLYHDVGGLSMEKADDGTFYRRIQTSENGVTAARPSATAVDGQTYYDTTLRTLVAWGPNNGYGVPGWVHAGAVIPTGTTAGRPTLSTNHPGTAYFDTTINRPIWWNGTIWVNPDGAQNLTITGDGTTTAFTVTHNLNLSTVTSPAYMPTAISLLSPAGEYITPGGAITVDDLTATTLRVNFDVAPGNGQVYRIRIKP